MFHQDPFSGHVVLRSTDAATAGSDYKLWTTLKAPRGFSLEAHAELLRDRVGATPLLDADGAALVVHAGPDDLMTDPAGNSGGRIACGVFVPG